MLQADLLPLDSVFQKINKSVITKQWSGKPVGDQKG